MSDIKLNFINNSNDANNSQVVIFQQNMAEDYRPNPVAWKVIRECGPGMNHPFVYESSLMICANDAFGNFTPKQAAVEGQAFEMVHGTTGCVLQQADHPARENTIEIANHLDKGVIGMHFYRNGRLLSTRTGMPPGQKGMLAFRPSILIGVVSQITEGDVMDDAILEQLNTEISLNGIVSADIVMTGGGAGEEAVPFSFRVENIIRQH
jgi:hypothetical protein